MYLTAASGQNGDGLPDGQRVQRSATRAGPGIGR